MAKRLLFFASPVLLIVACTTSKMPTAPSSPNVESGALAHVGHGTTGADTAAGNPNSGAHDDKGYIDGWFNGQRVALYYTKTFFCAEPPDSSASTGCELGADAETAPRPGPIPSIYAIAAAGGIQPPLDTLAPRASSGSTVNVWVPVRDESVRPGDRLSESPAHDRCVTRWRTSERTRRAA